MGTGSTTAATVRPSHDRNGRFALGNDGGPGRTKGSVNQNEIDGRALRKEILHSWKRCDGNKILDRLAETDPKFYVKLMFSVLPRAEVQPSAAQTFSLAALIAAIEVRDGTQPRIVESQSAPEVSVKALPTAPETAGDLGDPDSGAT